MRTIAVCPACSSPSSTVIASLDSPSRRERFVQFSDVKYGGLLCAALADVTPVVLQCDVCGHCWYRHQPEPEQLDRMYASGRALFADVPRTREPSSTMTLEMMRLRRLVDSSGTRVSTLLDYGSGYGRWARAAVQAGFQVTAFEPSAARGGEGETPFELVHDLNMLRGRRFAVVHLQQVLEHVPDPLVALRDLRSFCTTHTVLRITVPNLLRTPEGSALWDRWPFDGRTAHTMAPFEHLHGFTPDSLDRLLRAAGMVPLSASTVMRQYPSALLRAWLGNLVPSLGSTLRLVSLA